MDSLRLDQQLCFPLYATSRAVTSLYRPFLDPLGITYPQYLVLLVLWEKDSLALKEIGEKLFLDSGTLTPLLKKMEEKGLVIRNRSENDERNLVITLTTRGRQMKNQAVCIPQKIFEESGLSAEKAMKLKSDLADLLAKLHSVQSRTD